MKQNNGQQETLCNNRMTKFTLPIKWIIFSLIIIPIALGIMNFLANPFIDPANHTFWGGTVYELFAMDHEKNLPTWYSTILLFLCGQLCLIAGILERIKKNPLAVWWILVGIAFVFLAADEAAGFHEPLAVYLRHYKPDYFSGFMRGAGWFIPYLIVVLALLPLLVKKFLLKIPRQTAVLMMTSAGIFLIGAVGFEMVGGIVWDDFHDRMQSQKIQFWYQITVFFEEMFEIAGTSLFVVTLSKYINSKKISFCLP